MNVVYDCYIPEVMGYAERGYCFRCGQNALLMWDGYFSELMQAMWTVYGWVPDPDDPGHPNINQVPLLRDWNENSCIGTHGPVPIEELRATAKALRDTATALRRSGPNLVETPLHGEVLAQFLDQASVTGQSVSIEEWWG